MTGGNSERIFGRHPIHEALVAGRRSFDRIYVAEGVEHQGVLEQILQKAGDVKISVDFVSKDFLDQVNPHHQGVVAEVSPYPYVSLQDVLLKMSIAEDSPIILLLDVIQNPQNVGTLLRTAEAVGVSGVVLPLRRGVGITPAVVRSSAGATEHLWITQGNLAQSIKLLKKEGLWIIGLDIAPEARSLGQVDLLGPIGLVVGGEGEGLRRLVRESCDFLMRLPMRGKIESLNAAIAGSIALYAIWQARGFNDLEKGEES
jgi:23S rRNA (guanosine2251-2'-O)-methyltransferase